MAMTPSVALVSAAAASLSERKEDPRVQSDPARKATRPRYSSLITVTLKRSKDEPRVALPEATRT